MDGAPSRRFVQGRSDPTDDYRRRSSQHQDYDSTQDNPTATAVAASSATSKQSNTRENEASNPDEGAKGKTGGSSTSSSAAPRIRRRNRMITSCLECRRRKLRCDRLHPCSNCAKLKRDCVYLAPALDSRSKKKLADLKEKMGSLEKVLEQDVAGKGVWVRAGEGGGDKGKERQRERERERAGDKEYGSYEGGVVGAGREGYEDEPVPEDEAFLEPTQMISQDAAYEDEADDDVSDLGFRFGKMRMTDRVGGYFRPRINEELTQALRGLSVSPSEEEQDKDTSVQPPPRLRDLLSTQNDDYFKPSPSFMAPRSDLFFSAESLRKYTLFDFLPSRHATDTLMKRYWESVHTIAKTVHRPSFEKRYDIFWEDVLRGLEPPPSLQAAVFAAMLSAVTSMPERMVLNTFGVPQKNLLENFQLGTEMALGKAHFLKTTKTETLQALVMYLIPLCRSEISRAHTSIVGAAIRLAECMGLHRDPSEYDLPPLETHVRRMIWYQLCFLDVRTGDIQGPRATIRREDYSTRFPLNVDDIELQNSTTAPLRDMPRWTDMTFTRIRLEWCEFHRIICDDNARLDRKAVSITHVLGKIESFRKACYAKYWPHINCPNQKPVQRACGLMLSTLICGLYITVLHRYHVGVSVRIPDRLRQIIIMAGTQQMESSIELETSPELQNWAWYVCAFQQYHTALLLLIEVIMHPTRREAHRIWRCLDAIYEVPSLPLESEPVAGREVTFKELIEYRTKKGIYILTQIRDRMSAYRDSRKLKIPARLREKHIYVGSSPPGMGRDLLVSKPEDVQSAEKARNTDSGIEDQTSQLQFPEVPFGGISLPLTTAFLSNLPNTTYPVQLPQPSQQQQQASAQPYLYPQVQNPPAPQYQPPTQNNPQLYTAWQQQSQQPGSLSWDPNPSASNTLPATYDTQEALNTSSGSKQGLEYVTAEPEDSGDAALWFMSNMEAPGAGVAAPLQSMDVPPEEDQAMIDIDWNEWDKLFPPEINNGDLNMPIQSMEDQPIPMDASFDTFLSP